MSVSQNDTLWESNLENVCDKWTSSTASIAAKLSMIATFGVKGVINVGLKSLNNIEGTVVLVINSYVYCHLTCHLLLVQQMRKVMTQRGKT